jgi:hypothetical protein
MDPYGVWIKGPVTSKPKKETKSKEKKDSKPKAKKETKGQKRQKNAKDNVKGKKQKV